MTEPGVYPPRGPEDYSSLSPDAATFARVEGLIGEEHALLAIPEAERSDEQHDRLRAIAAELDRLWHKLRERAERLAAAQQPAN